MSDVDELLANEAYRDARRQRPSHPSGWEPHVEENGDRAVAISEPTDDPNPDEDRLIRAWGFDPAEWRIDGPINCRRWQSNLGRKDRGADAEVRWLYYYKANLVRRGKSADSDFDALVSEVRRWKKPKRTAPTGDHALIVCLSDWQLGKRDGHGTKGTTSLILDLIGSVVDRVAALRKSGVEVGSLYVVGLGDLVEGCDGHYATQTFQVELDRREQVKLVRRLLVRALKEWSPLFEKVVVSCVPGNHGENRKNGKAYTKPGDNDDVAVFEQASEVLAENPDRFGHVRFAIPDETLTVTLDVAGTIVSFAHGHQFGGRGTPRQKAEGWWKGMGHARHPVGDADVLISGHFHHLNVVQDGPRLWVQCPTLDGGSDWWQERGGSPSVAGTVLLLVGPGGARLPEVL